MVTGISLALGILLFGLLAGINERDGEPCYMVTILLAMVILTGTLVVTSAPKSAVDELRELQKYCVSIGIATMTPVITESKFTLIPQAEELPYVTATGSIEINERK